MGLIIGLLVLLGVAPSFVWLLFYLKEDARHPEPKKLLLYVFLAGAGITFVVLPIQIFLNNFLASLGAGAYQPLALLLFAGVEEIFKFLAAYLIISRRQEFDEPLDAMIYMITAALGFAAVENVASLFQTTDGTFISVGSLETTILRFIGATLLHTISSGLVGYYWGRAMALGRDHGAAIGRGLLWATVLHAVFNYFILKFEAITVPTLFLIGSAFFILIDFERLKRLE